VVEMDLPEANNNHVVNVPGAYEIDRLEDRRPEMYELIAEPRSPRSGRQHKAWGVSPRSSTKIN